MPVTLGYSALKGVLRMPDAIQWDETAKPVAAAVDAVVEDDASGLTAH